MYTMAMVLQDILDLTGVDARPYIPIPPPGCPARVQSTRLYRDVYNTELRDVRNEKKRMIKFFKHYTLPEVNLPPDMTAYTLYGFKFGDRVFQRIGIYEETTAVDDRIETMYDDYPFIFIMAAYKVVAMLKRDTH